MLNRTRSMKALGMFALVMAALGASAGAQQRPAAPAAQRPAGGQDDSIRPASNRRADEGKGPYKTLVIRGAMLIDGTGAPPTRTR